MVTNSKKQVYTEKTFTGDYTHLDFSFQATKHLSLVLIYD